MKIELTCRQVTLIRRALDRAMYGKPEQSEEYKELDEIDAILWKAKAREITK